MSFQVILGRKRSSWAIYSHSRTIFVKPACKSYDSFCVIACDGIYDVSSNEDLMEYINFGLKTKRDVQTVANELLDTCLSLGSKDNMSAIILRFDYGSDAVGSCDNGDAESLSSNFNTEFDPKAAEKDEILLEKLKSCVFDELRSRGIHTPEVGTVLKNLPEHTFDLHIGDKKEKMLL